jgi:hypothetical protein
MSPRAKSSHVGSHVCLLSLAIGKTKFCFPSVLGTPTPRLRRYDLFCPPWHSPIWIGSAFTFHEMDVEAFLLLHQDSPAGSPNQPVLCLNRRSWDSKWETFQVWMDMSLKMRFCCPKEIIWICLGCHASLQCLTLEKSCIAFVFNRGIWTLHIFCGTY